MGTFGPDTLCRRAKKSPITNDEAFYLYGARRQNRTGSRAGPTLCGGEQKKAPSRMMRPFICMVPGDRIELPTRGFSIPCSTD